MGSLRVFRTSLVARLAAILGVGAVVVLTVTSWISYRSTEANQVKVQNARIVAEVAAASSKLDEVLAKASAIAETVNGFQATQGAYGTPLTQKFVIEALGRLPKESVFALYFIAEKANYRDQLRSGPYVTRGTWPNLNPMTYDYHADDQKWFSVPRKTKKPALSEPYFDAGASNITMVSYTAPLLTKEGEFLGVGGVDIGTDQLVEQMKSVRLDLGTGSAQRQSGMLVSPEGLLIAHENQDLLPHKGFKGTNISSLPEGKLIGDKPSGVATFDLKGERQVLVWTTSPLSKWRTILRVPERDLYAGLAAIRNQAIGFSLLTVVLMVGLLGFILQRSLRSLSPLAQAADRLAQGDTTVEISVSSQDEIGRVASAFQKIAEAQRARAEVALHLADGDLTQVIEPLGPKDQLGQAFAEMVTTWSDVVSRLRRLSQNLGVGTTDLSNIATHAQQAAQQVRESAELVSSATSQAATSSQEIAGGSEQLAHSATSASGAMETVQQALVGVRSASESQQQQAVAATETMDDAEKRISATGASMIHIESATREVVDAVQRLGERQTEISAIVGTIGSIAEQTNLLALNAAIEAARAGEQGRGFAVVAEEVRKLAERSSQATQEIGTLIEQVREDVDTAVSTISRSSAAVGEGAVQTKEAQQAFISLRDAIQSVREQAVGNLARVREMEAQADRLRDAVENVAAVSEETAAGAQELTATSDEIANQTSQVASAISEQSSLLEQVSDNADAQRTLAGELVELVSIFRIAEAEVAAKSRRAA